jgi:hypothetical protein
MKSYLRWRGIEATLQLSQSTNSKVVVIGRSPTACGSCQEGKADRYSANLLPVIRDIQRSGIKLLRGVARALVARGIPTARGGAWTPVQVSAILQRSR